MSKLSSPIALTRGGGYHRPFFLFSRSLIGQALTNYAQKSLLGAIFIAVTVALAMVVTIIVFSQIAVKVVFAAVLVYAFHATFED